MIYDTTLMITHYVHVVFGTFAQEVLFDEALERPEVVRVLAVDERQRA